jgi:hypothetical protein
MKTYFLLIMVCVILCSCNNQTKTAAVKKDSLNFPFTPRYSINWQPGDEKNALLVLNCLKKYIAGDVKGATAYFADTAGFVADKFRFWGSRDSLTKIIADMRNASVTVSKDFDSWMTTYYPDKKETWVTLWYTERTTDKQGKRDSIYFTDDVMLKNGKIVLYDEKQRLFPEPVSKK